MRRSLLIAAFVLFGCTASAGSASAASLVADYRFNNGINSSVGSPPALTQYGPGPLAFQADTVNGVPDQVLNFPKSTGLEMNATGLLAQDTYTFVITFKFTGLPGLGGYSRVLDTLLGASDSGLYVKGSHLDYYSDDDNFGVAPIVLDTYRNVAITRSGVSKQIDLYVDGAPDLTYNDTTDTGIITSSRVVRFFRDDSDADEEAAGAVARIRAFDGQLSAAEIAALPNTEPVTGSPPTPPAPKGATSSIAGKVKTTKGKKGKVTVDTGVLAACPAGGAACTGTGSITTTTKLAKRVAVAKKTITIAAGQSQRVKLTLSKKASKKLRKAGKLKAKIAVIVTGPDGKPVSSERSATLKLAKKR